MAAEIVQPVLDNLQEFLQRPFYYSPEFLISNAIGISGLVFSILAFSEARQAKRAAAEAGTTVKIQTVTIELSEIAQRLDRLDMDVEFHEARDLLNEISRRLRRLIAPFQSSATMTATCDRLKNALNETKSALEGVRPPLNGETIEPANSVYFATQGHFSDISSIVAEIMGLFEKRSIQEII